MNNNGLILAKVLVCLALVCFVVAWLESSGNVSGGNVTTWVAGGLAFLAASFLP